MENKHVSEELGEWQEVHSPFSTISAKVINGEDNSSVVKDNFFPGSSVFPPGNHEDLPISNPGDDHQHLEETEPIHTPGGDGDGVRRWIRLHVGVVQTGIFRVFGRFRNCVTRKVGLWFFAWIAGGVAAALLVSFWRRRVLVWWQRRLQLDSSRKSLLAIIDEKNKKINQLLLQIAQMNEMLVARRRVPVLRVK